MQRKKTYTVNEAKLVLERYCIYQERCHKEVQKKLDEMSMIIEAKELIILHLLQHDFLNEERFTKSYVSGKFNIKKWGKIKIISQLKYRYISDYNIKSALSIINEDDYLKVLFDLAYKKKLFIRGKNEFDKRKKLTNFLLSRGFEIHLIIDVVNELFKK